jgi:hypothetical protein
VANDSLVRYVQGFDNPQDQYFLRTVIGAVWDRLSSQALSSAGLVIKAGASTLVKTGGSAQYLIANGKLQKINSATDMPALSGTVTNAKFNVFAFFIDQGGTTTSAMGVEGATLAAVKFPPIPEGKALIGFVVINPTGTGNFVGGTTALDDATVVPNAAYVSSVGPIDPTLILS